MSAPEYSEIAWIKLGAKHQPTRLAKTYTSGKVDPPPKVLRLLTSASNELCYLYYCDEEGKPINDSLHDNIADAMAEAAKRFNVREFDWQRIPFPGEAIWAVLVWPTADEFADRSQARKGRRQRESRNRHLRS